MVNNRGKIHKRSVDTATPLRILMYSHDTLGLGHLKRNLKIAEALKRKCPETAIMLLTGSKALQHLDFPDNVEYIRLPGVRKTGPEKYDSIVTTFSFNQILSLRREIISKAAKEFIPHLFIVDHAPLGMKKEILPALEWLKRNNAQTISILGLRDILDDPDYVKGYWTETGIYEVMSILYDHIFIYGSPQVFDPVSQYRFPQMIRDKTIYTGYITDGLIDPPGNEQASESRQNKKEILVTIGGGEWMGEVIIANLIEMYKIYNSKIDFSCHILTGPFMPDDLWQDFQKAAREFPIRIQRFNQNIGDLLRNSDLVIATAGYNTVTDILSYAKKALIIPRVKYRKEQLIRSARLSELGLVSFMHPETVGPDSLYQAISDALNQSDFPLIDGRIKKSLPLDGAERVADLIGNMVPGLSKSREVTS